MYSFDASRSSGEPSTFSRLGPNTCTNSFPPLQVRMTDRGKKFLLDLRDRDGNNQCVECGQKEPEWTSCSLGVFLCEACASIHRSLGTVISRTKSIKLDNWDEAQLRHMEAEGNLRSKQKYEQFVPSCYKQPSPNDPQVLREQWIRAKYERLEFQDPEKQTYLAGRREGYMWKRGRDDKKFQKRLFVLDTTENVLKYYVKDEAKEPKAKLRVDDINVALVPLKIGNPNAMQILYIVDGHTRNLFVYGEDGKDTMDWYTAIRAAKLSRLAIAYPGMSEQELCQNLTRDFLNEGWLSKTGPRPNDAYRKRWFTLDRRRLMYYEDPLDAYPKGEIIVGTKDRGFVVRDGVPQTIKDPGYTFTLRTPDRHFHFAAENQTEKQKWMEVIKSVIDSPLTVQESSSMLRSVKQ